MSEEINTNPDKEFLLNVPLPEKTDTYTAIPHGLVMSVLEEKLKAKGYVIKHETFKYNSSGDIACGIYQVGTEDDQDLGMLFSWANSYDKSRRFRFAMGAYVKINGMSILGLDEGKEVKRKHTGESDKQVIAIIDEQIDNATIYYDQLVRDKEEMKLITLDERSFAELLGRLYLIEKQLTGEQLGIIAKEFKKPSVQYENEFSLWTLYNHILHALVKCHPSKWMQQLRAMHTFIVQEFKITQYDPITNEAIQTTERLVKQSLTKSEKAPANIEGGPVLKNVVESLSLDKNGAQNPDKVQAEGPAFDINANAAESMTSESEKTSDGSIIMSLLELEEISPGAGENSIVVLDAMEYTVRLLPGEENAKLELRMAVDEEVPGPIDEDSEFAETTLEEAETTFETTAFEETIETTVEEKPVEAPPVEEPKVESAPVAKPAGLPLPPGKKVVIPVKTQIPAAVKEEKPVEKPVETPVVKEEPKVLEPAKMTIEPKEIKIQAPAKPNPEDQKTLIEKVIAAELLEAYSEIKEFTFELKGTQYNIKLSTGETIVLTKGYVDAEVAKKKK